jgi:hypothetical protein
MSMSIEDTPRTCRLERRGKARVLVSAYMRDVGWSDAVSVERAERIVGRSICRLERHRIVECSSIGRQERQGLHLSFHETLPDTVPLCLPLPFLPLPASACSFSS